LKDAWRDHSRKRGIASNLLGQSAQSMSDTRQAAPSIADQVRRIEADGLVVAVHFLADLTVFVLGDEALLLVSADGEKRRVPTHGGAILDSAGDDQRVVTGGDDGRLVATDAAGVSTVITADAKRHWIDHVALGPDGAVAWSAGKQAFVRTGKDEIRTLDLPSSVGGLAFAPKGFRLAIGHYGGATLWFPNASNAKPEFLDWKGSHLTATFSPDGRFLVTAMQEPTLHGWRLVDGKHMRMAGYSAKVRSLSWSTGGKWLASSGAGELVLWPFAAKDGPMGKQPRLVAPMDKRVVAVACHPTQDVVAVGYEHGLILLVRIDDGAEILVNKPSGAAVSAISWNAAGAMLAFGCENGQAGVLPLR
jgi:WD40 repeat protein